jgi:hypothetical protein
MYTFKHRYYHPEGHPLARLVLSYENEFVELMQKCFTIPGLKPRIKIFKNLDYSWNEMLWSWDTKEIYQRWVAVAEWQPALVIGLQYSDSVGVTQVRGLADYEVIPTDGMIEITMDQSILDYKTSHFILSESTK